jgi:hypothetical protein
VIYLIGDPNPQSRRLIAGRDYLGSMVTPPHISRIAGAFALDNGAWAHRDEPEWWVARGEAQFLSAMRRVSGEHRTPLFVVCPDVVGDARATLNRWPRYAETIRLHGFVAALALQDGMRTGDVERCAPDALFLGGSTDWKLATMRYWGDVARTRTLWYHVARVNTVRRIDMACDAGAHSCDGTAIARFPKAQWRVLGGTLAQRRLFDHA